MVTVVLVVKVTEVVVVVVVTVVVVVMTVVVVFVLTSVSLFVVLVVVMTVVSVVVMTLVLAVDVTCGEVDLDKRTDRDYVSIDSCSRANVIVIMTVLNNDRASYDSGRNNSCSRDSYIVGDPLITQMMVAVAVVLAVVIIIVMVDV